MVPCDIFASVELNASSIADKESVCRDIPPPQNYLPRGWILFKTRGPMSLPMEHRMDFFAERYSDNKRNVKNGRDHFCKESAKEKAKSRDHAYDNSAGNIKSMDIRGVGGDSRKFAVRNAQRDAQITLQRLEADLLRVNSVMTSKHKARADQLEMVRLHIALGETDKAKEQLSLAKESFPEIAALEAETMKLNGKISAQEAGVAEETKSVAAAGSSNATGSSTPNSAEHNDNK